jgi:hypothetical protein
MSDDEPRRPGQPPGSSEPTVPIEQGASSDAGRTSGGDGAPDAPIAQANALTRRSMIAALAALFLFGSCGIGYAVFRSGGGGGETVFASPSPGPGSPSPSPGPSVSPSAVAGVDLLVTELTGTRVAVQNVGTAAAGRFVVSLGGRAFIVEDGLAPGEGTAFGFACRSGPLTAIADATERVEETDETNNVRTAGPFECESPTPTASPSPSASPSASPTGSPTTEPPLPDLVVSTVASDHVVVKNIGDGPAGGFVVDAGDAGTFNLSGLSAGGSRTLPFDCTEGPIVVIVDATGLVVESNEGNNQRTGGPFTCLPDLVVAAIGIDSVTIANEGVGGAGPSTLSVNGQTFDVPAIGAGGSIEVHSGCFGGVVQAIADLLDEVAESNEGNNARTTDVGDCP